MTVKIYLEGGWKELRGRAAEVVPKENLPRSPPGGEGEEEKTQTEELRGMGRMCVVKTIGSICCSDGRRGQWTPQVSRFPEAPLLTCGWLKRW